MNDLILNTNDIVVNLKTENDTDIKPYKLVGLFEAGDLKREYGAFIPVGSMQDDMNAEFVLLRCERKKVENSDDYKISFYTITSPREFQDVNSEFYTLATKQEVGFDTIISADGSQRVELTVQDENGDYVHGTLLTMFDCPATGFKYMAVQMHVVNSDKSIPIQIFRYEADENNIYIYNIKSEKEEQLAIETFDRLVQ